MAKMEIIIPPANVDRVGEAFESFFPIPQRINPEYEADPQPDNPSDNPSLWTYDYDFNTPEYINKFGRVPWIKRKLRAYLRDILRRYETRRDQNIAKNAVDVPEDITS